MKKNTLSAEELSEPMFVTWGRIVGSAGYINDKRLSALVSKFNDDLKKAKIEQNYFKSNE